MLSSLEKLNNPTKRRAIVVLSSPKYERLRAENDDSWMEKDEILVINLGDREIRNDKLYKRLEEEGFLVNGNVLLQDPYKWNRYFISNDNSSIDNIIKNSAINKYYLFSQLCSLLGAKSVECTETKLKTSKGTRVGNMDTNYGAINGKIDVEQEKADSFAQKLRLKDIYDSNNEVNIEEAEKFLQLNHLSNDIAISNLVDIMSTSHKLKERIIELDLTTEITNTLHIATNISSVVWKVGADLKTSLKKNEVISIRINIKF